MNANENLKNAIVEFGVVLIKSNIILLLITLFYYYAIFVPTHQGKEMVSIPVIIAVPLYIGTLACVSGFILLLIGLLIDLIGLLKNLLARLMTRARRMISKGKPMP